MIELLGQGLALTRHCKLGVRKNSVHATSFLLNTNNLVPQRDISASVPVKHFKGLAVKVLNCFQCGVLLFSPSRLHMFGVLDLC